MPLLRPGRHTIPNTYVITERGAAIPVAAQEAVGRRSHRVRGIDSRHSPFLPSRRAPRY
jgi:hypothetical protein